MKTVEEILNYLKDMFLKAETPEDFSEDFYKFAFQDCAFMLEKNDVVKVKKEDLACYFDSITEAKEKLKNCDVEEGVEIIITPKKKKPIVYVYENKVWKKK